MLAHKGIAMCSEGTGNMTLEAEPHCSTGVRQTLPSSSVVASAAFAL